MHQLITLSLFAWSFFNFNGKINANLPTTRSFNKTQAVTTFLKTNEHGIATFYADKYNGNLTASGEKLDITSFVCAHPTLPLGTVLKVTSAVDQKTIIVKVIDRGPFNKKYSISLTSMGARAIGITTVDKGYGSLEVDMEPVDKETPLGLWTEAGANSLAAMQELKKKAAQIAPKTAATGLKRLGIPTQEEEKEPVIANNSGINDPTNPAISFPIIPRIKNQEEPPASLAAAKPVEPESAKPQEQPTIYEVDYHRKAIEAKGFGVQFGAMNDYEKAMDIVQNLRESGIAKVSISNKTGQSSNLYKVIVGPLDDEKTAFEYLDICRAKKFDCYVVNLENMELVKDKRQVVTPAAKPMGKKAKK